MNIIDHLSLGVANIAEGKTFYDKVMSTIGCSVLAEHKIFVAYGKSTPRFLIMLPLNKQPYSSGNGSHTCFVARSQNEVNKFYQTALDNGGSCAGAPGPRSDYPKAGVYTAFIRDPFGNKLEVIHNGFAV